MKIIITAIVSIFLFACTESVSFDTVKAQRATANENSRYNAQKWRAENGYEKLCILARGDSTQQTKCPQGDGWASVDLTNPDTKQVEVKLKCSTVSANIGCMLSDDFKARAGLASQENRCNFELPVVVRKIEQ